MLKKANYLREKIKHHYYTLDEEILGFCVSEENQKIYATTLNYTNQILIYDLPKFN